MGYFRLKPRQLTNKLISKLIFILIKWVLLYNDFLFHLNVRTFRPRKSSFFKLYIRILCMPLKFFHFRSHLFEFQKLFHNIIHFITAYFTYINILILKFEIFGIVHEFSINIILNLVDIRLFGMCEHTIGYSLLVGTSSSPTPMDKDLHAGRKIKMKDILHIRDINTPCAKISHY